MLYAGSSVNGIVDSLRVHHATVFWVKKMKEGKLIECTKPTRRKCALRMEDTTKVIIKSLKENPTKFMHSLVKEHFLAPTTVSKIMKKARGKFKAIVKRPLLLEKTRAIQLEHAKKLLNNLKHTKDCLIFFSDEKTVMVNPVCNHCNNWYMEFDNNMEDHIRYIFLMKHALAVMFLGLVCSNGSLIPCLI